MKKFITLLLVGLMVLCSSIGVFAEEPVDTQNQDLLEQGQDIKAERMSVETLKEFADEIHQINALRVERNQLQIKVVEKQDQLVDLILAAKEAEDMEILKAAKEERKQVKSIHEEIKELHDQAAAAREAFREAKKSNDAEAANAELEKLIDIHSTINTKLQEKLDILDNVIDILS